MKTENKTLLNFQADWEKLVDKGMDNYNALSADERIWFNIEALIAQVDNGGIISHYYNSGADYNAETIADLHTLGFSNVAALLKNVNNLFPDCYPPADMEERNEIIASWPAQYDDLLTHIDQKFYELEKRLIQHIETKGLTS